MESEKESLFSLELVVEKLYVPHVTCRFPAVAFRLLDFPTILINHVEDDLAERLKKKISLDPYYQLPNQFTELKDRDGNFLVKRGKSCLFKMSPKALKSHLSSIPLYVMVIDTFPEVPKLLGTSSIPLNTVMNSICTDIKKRGITVPAVHGDRGLFKIYSLMGKEIGYAVLGYRLLGLGPGLISHLPQTAFAQRESQKDKQMVPKQFNRHESVLQEMTSSSFMKMDEKLSNTRDMGSMTNVEKHDALIQTVEMLDKNIHVEITGKDENTKEEPAKEYKSHCTQTEKRRKHKQHILRNELEFDKDNESDNDDFIIYRNINCPPPLFYNSKCEPAVKIQRPFIHDYDSIFEEDISLESVSDEEGKRKNDTCENSKPASEIKQQQQHDLKSLEKQQKSDSKALTVVHNQPAEKQSPSVLFSLQNQSDNIFPILTALMNEVEQLKNQQFQTAVYQQKTQAPFIQQKSVKQQPPKLDLQKVSTGPQQPLKVQSSDQKENVRDAEKDENKSSRKKTRKSHKKCAHQSQAVPKQKGWIRQTPGTDIKKSQLVFGLTHTQRLRLVKGNPEWLKNIEKEAALAKAQKQKIQRTREVETDVDDAGNLSDTYTEVRRLQAAEMEQGEITSPEAEKSKEAIKSCKKKSPVRSDKYKDNSARKTRRRSKSPKQKSKQKDSRKEHKATEPALGHESEENVKEKPSSVDSELGDIASPDINYDENSMLDSLQSSRSQKSIEVHIPSAQMNYESDQTLDHDESEPEEELGKSRKSHFPGFIDKDTSMPESIKGVPNKSLNVSEDIDEYHPLESTRYSKQYQSESQLFKSTDDFDTKQFQSTDEPELQKLVSDDEHSDSFEVTPTVTEQSLTRSSSPLPAGVNTSLQSAKFKVLNPTVSQQSPIPALRRSFVKLDTTTARPSPTGTPRSGTSQPSPSPRPRVRPREKKFDFKRDSIHTESVSSYMPSDPENVNISLLSDGSYSDDFHMSSEKDLSTASKRSTPELPKLIPSTKLGYTIH